MVFLRLMITFRSFIRQTLLITYFKAGLFYKFMIIHNFIQ